MIRNVYSVYDTVAQFYGPMVLFHSDVDAQRSIAVGMNNPDSVLGKRPGDYRLFFVGRFDDSTGVVSECDNPRLVCELITLVRSLGVERGSVVGESDC